MMINQKKAYLLLEDGTFIEGNGIGVEGTTGGEICFNTGMTGYQEIYTDPSYYGQIIINTVSHVGNYGVNEEEQEAEKPMFNGLICKYFSPIHSRKKSSGSLQSYFEKFNIVGIEKVDTRALVRHIRKKGAQNCVISTESNSKTFLQTKLEEIPKMAGLELSSKVSTKEPYFYGLETSKYKVAVLDLGIKKSILKNLSIRGIYCRVYPAKTSFEEMEKWNPAGYFISNGPGDPAAMDYAIKTVKKILNSNKPVFGICLGHQLLGLAAGAKTYKMHHGHRGLNHPVKNLQTGMGEITSQNHGFALDEVSLRDFDNIFITHLNLNDNTVEGIRFKDRPAFSVQYHPEASPGPHDSHYLFDEFVKLF